MVQRSIGDMHHGPTMGATVKVVEPTGVETFVFAEYAGRGIACQVMRDAAPKQKDNIRLSPKRSGIMLFDKSSGKRAY